METNKYVYREAPLTAAVAIELMREMYGGSGSAFTREELVTTVTNEHLGRGGAACASKNPAGSTFKKALSVMKRRREVENCGFGRWRFLSVCENEEGEELHEREYVVNDAPPADTPGLYLYYYRSYAALAEFEGVKRWLCKVGVSGRGVRARITEQVSTATPELPTLGLSVSCTRPEAFSLESAVHAMLAARGLKSADSGGNEWFYTSPSEVCESVRWLLPHLSVQHEMSSCLGPGSCGAALHDGST